MAIVFADRVKETSSTTGTGTLNLGGAVAGFQGFVAGIGDTNTCYYVIEDSNGAWETGVGVVTAAAPDTLTRNVLNSSNSNALISCSGDEIVFVDATSRLFQPLKTLWVPAKEITPVTTNGCAVLALVEGTVGRPEQETLDFDGAADESAQFHVAFPKGWAKGTIKFQYFWTGLAGSGNVLFALAAVALADNDLIDTVYGTAIGVVDSFIAANDLHVSDLSAAVTIAGSPNDDELVYFHLLRLPTNAADTRTVDSKLLGIKLFYTLAVITDL